VGAVHDGLLVSQKDVLLKMLLPRSENSSVHVHKGSVAPICGWVSRAFDQRTPAPAIVWRARLTGNTVLRTELLISSTEDQDVR
jgi:hypothetical protein